MLKSNPAPTVDFLHGIHDIIHPLPDGSFFINHSCFNVENHIIIPNQIYLLCDYYEDSIYSIIPFRLEDILIVNDFIMVTGIDMVSGEELGRNEYLMDNTGCAFKLMDFDYLKNTMNTVNIKANLE